MTPTPQGPHVDMHVILDGSPSQSQHVSPPRSTIQLHPCSPVGAQDQALPLWSGRHGPVRPYNLNMSTCYITCWWLRSGVGAAVAIVVAVSAGVLGSRSWPGMHVTWNPTAAQSFAQQHELQAQPVLTAAISTIRPDRLARLGSVLQQEAAVSASRLKSPQIAGALDLGP